MAVSEAKRLKELEQENARLKKLLADVSVGQTLFQHLETKNRDYGRSI